MRPPYGSLLLAFLGIAGYVAGLIAQLDMTRTSDVIRISTGVLATYSPFVVAASSAVAVAGLVGALWWANGATGRGAAAWSGLAFGILGSLGLLAGGALLPYLLLTRPALVPTLFAGDGTVGTALGSILAFLGLAFLCVGLASRSALDAGPAANRTSDEAADQRAAGALDSLSDLLQGY